MRAGRTRAALSRGLEKGIEYRGSLAAFAAALRAHAELAEALGPYKLSLHSGSDKLSLYAELVRETGGRFHVKTAGTSYLEALRVTATAQPDLLRRIWAIAREPLRDRPRDLRAHGDAADAPPAEPDDGELPALLDDDPARRILHVTFGSVLGDARLHAALVETISGDGFEPLFRGARAPSRKTPGTDCSRVRTASEGGLTLRSAGW